MIAYRLDEQKDVYKLNLLAWQTNQARATKKNGRPVFRTFDELYDQEKRFLQALKGKTPKEKQKMSMADINMMMNN